MASPVTNRRAINSSNSVEPFNRQSRARTLLIEGPRRSLKKGGHYKAIGSQHQAEEEIIEESDKESFVDLKGDPIASYPSAHSRVSCLFALDRCRR
jgi:hypothetical protein